ncbi:MAG TPA: hypothetical protein VEC17_00080 [Candidatus Binatia bacterium]|nr:hypothetical protein [Candidatus Binatia bacterium]
MFNFKDEINLILQGLIAVILIGMFYSLWMTTKAYGGLIGHAIRMLGIGIILISVVVLERMLINFSVIESSVTLNAAQDVLTLLSLLFLSMGFKRLAAAGKTP